MTDLVPQTEQVIPWTAAFAADIALEQKKIVDICKDHNVTSAEWLKLSADPEFEGMVNSIRLALRKDGGSYRVKSKLAAERILPEMERATKDESVPWTVRADLMKYITKSSGYDASNESAKAGPGSGFSINIVLK